VNRTNDELLHFYQVNSNAALTENKCAPEQWTTKFRQVVWQCSMHRW